MLHYGNGQVISCHLGQWVQSLIHQPDIFVFLVFRVSFRCLFAYSRHAIVPFSEEWLLSCRWQRPSCKCAHWDFQSCRNLFRIVLQIYASTHPWLRGLQTILWTFFLGLCSDMHYQLWDLIQTGVYLSKSCLINWIHHRWTSAKL